MLDTERENLPNVLWEINKGTPLIIAFTGMGDRLHELNFEWINFTRHASCNKIYCKDPDKSWFVTWPIEKLQKELSAIILEMNPSKIICVGASAGGYAALFIGHFLKVDTVHAFGAQTFISRGMKNYEEKTIRLYDQGHVCQDLKDILVEPNGKTQYYLHTGTEEEDYKHATHLEGIPQVEIVTYACNTHACAGQWLKSNGKLHEVIRI